MRRTRPSAGRYRKRSSSAGGVLPDQEAGAFDVVGSGEADEHAVAVGAAAAQARHGQRAFARAALPVEEPHGHLEAAVAAGVAGIDLTADPVGRFAARGRRWAERNVVSVTAQAARRQCASWRSRFCEMFHANYVKCFTRPQVGRSAVSRASPSLGPTTRPDRDAGYTLQVPPNRRSSGRLRQSPALADGRWSAAASPRALRVLLDVDVAERHATVAIIVTRRVRVWAAVLAVDDDFVCHDVPHSAPPLSAAAPRV